MIDNRISAALPQKDLDAILGAVTQIKARMPFLINLSPGERRKLAKSGDRSRGFITRALEVATLNPGILPQMFSLEEMRKDVELFQKLQQIQLSLNQLLELVDSTVAITQNESYAAALAVYGFAKAGGKAAALQEARSDLSKRFARKTSTSAKSNQPTTPSNSPASTAQSTSNQ